MSSVRSDKTDSVSPDPSGALGGRVLAIGLLAWVGAVSVLGLSGISDLPSPVLLMVPGLPAVALISAYRFSSGFRSRVNRIDPGTLIRWQVIRVAGGVFLYYAAIGRLPWFWAGPVAVWDLAVGFSAPRFGRRLTSDRDRCRRSGRLFNYFGLTDFAVALPIGAMTLAGPFQLIHSTPSIAAVMEFPMIVIAGVGVPLTLCMHLLSLRLLREDGQT